MNLGTFKDQVWFWRAAAWFLRIAPLVFLLIVFAALRRFSRKESKTEYTETDSKIEVGEAIKNHSTLRVWLGLHKSIRRFEHCQTNSSGQISDCLKAEAEIVSAIKDYLRIKALRLSVGNTPLSMAEHISENIDQYSTKKDALLQLARKAVVYQADIEKGKDGYFRSPLVEAKELRLILGQLRLYRRAIPLIRNSFLKAGNRFRRRQQ